MTTAVNRGNSNRPSDSLPLRLVMLRHESGRLSQREAAMRCGITPRVWQGMEEGRSTNDLLGILKRIADEFQYDREWLTWGGPLEQENPRPDDPNGGDVRHQGLEPRTRWLRACDGILTSNPVKGLNTQESAA